MERRNTMSVEEVTAPALPGSALETMLDDKTTSTWFRRDRIVFPWQKAARAQEPDFAGDWNDSDVAMYPSQDARVPAREPTVRRWPVRFSAAVENLNARGRSLLRARPAPPPPPSRNAPHTLRSVPLPPSAASTQRTAGARARTATRTGAVAPARTGRFDAAQSGALAAAQLPRRASVPSAHRAFAPPSALTGGMPAVTATGAVPAGTVNAWEERAAEAHARAVSEEAAQFRSQTRLPFWVLSLLLGAALFVAMLFAGVVMFVDPSSNVLLESQPADAELRIDGERVPGDSSPFYVNRLRAGDHELWVHKPGFQDRRETFHVAPGETLRMPAIELLRQGQEPTPPAAVEPPAPPPAAAAPAKPRSTRGESGSPRIAAASSALSASASASAAAAPAPANAPNPDAALLENSPAGAHSDEPEGPAVVGGSNIGLLRVNSLPWSQVFIDGRAVGNTPLLGVPLKAGEHRVELVNQTMGLTKTIRVTIQKDQIVTKIVNLGE